MTHFHKALLLAAACTFAAQAQTPHDTLFSGVDRFEKNATSVTHVENDGRHSHDANKRSTVYVFKYDRPGLYNASDVESFRQKVQGADWTCKTCPGSGTASATGKLTLACTRPVGDSQESAVIVQRPQELTFVHSINPNSDGDHNHMTCYEDR